MKTKRILPVAAVVAAMLGAGAMVATAQDSGTAPQPAPEQVMPVHADGDRDGPKGKRPPQGEHRQHGGKDHGKKGPKGMHGPRGNSEIFMNLFTQVDTDEDGAVTQEEIDTFRAAKVGEADASGDGALSIEEFDTLYREFTRSRMVDMFQDFDADGDGVISPEEMDTRFGGVVEKMDRDGDGVLKLQPKRG
ncbi:MAG: hypothetical protein CML68_19550 [Rhodobacteraceae bacterium]|nr:hypothetical protein [Paracoccaceae bacterium]